MSPGSCITLDRARWSQSLECFCGRQKKHPPGTAAGCRVSLQGAPSTNTMLPFFSLSSISFLHSSNFVLNFCASAERRDFLRTLRSEGDKSSRCEEPGLVKGPSHGHSDTLGHLTWAGCTSAQTGQRLFLRPLQRLAALPSYRLPPDSVTMWAQQQCGSLCPGTLLSTHVDVAAG